MNTFSEFWHLTKLSMWHQLTKQGLSQDNVWETSIPIYYLRWCRSPPHPSPVVLPVLRASASTPRGRPTAANHLRSNPGAAVNDAAISSTHAAPPSSPAATRASRVHYRFLLAEGDCARPCRRRIPLPFAHPHPWTPNPAAKVLTKPRRRGLWSLSPPLWFDPRQPMLSTRNTSLIWSTVSRGKHRHQQHASVY
jgi:hypothetical protein